MKRARLTIGHFVNWQVRHLPKCVYPQNKWYSTIGLGRRQRNFVLAQYGYKDYNAYLRSDLWRTIRAKVLLNGKCVCGKKPNQVHHKTYTEANLLGETTRGLIALCGDCHYGIEFSEERKCSLGEANHNLKIQQLGSVTDLEPPTPEEIKVFLSGKQMPESRKWVVKRYLKSPEYNK